MVIGIVLLAHPDIGLPARIALAATVNYMAIGWLIAIFHNKLFRKYMLYFQVGYLVFFQVSILLVTYFR